MSPQTAGAALADADLALVRQQAATTWSALSGAHVFLTGGTGFVGRWLAESFLDANRALSLGARLTVLTRDPAGFAARAPHLVRGRELTLLAGDVRQTLPALGDVDFVIHGAATSGVAVDDAEHLAVIDGGTGNVLDAVVRARARRLLLISSGAVYGPLPPGAPPVDEDARGGPDPLRPQSAYGEAKRIAELRCAIAARGGDLSWSSARCFAFLGPHLPQDAHFAAGNFMADALARRRIVVRGDGTAVRSWMYAAELSSWLWQLLVAGGNGVAYNVGSDVAVSVRQLAERIGAIGGVGVDVLGVDVGNERSVYVPKTARARALGLRETLTLDAAIERTLAWSRGVSA